MLPQDPPYGDAFKHLYQNNHSWLREWLGSRLGNYHQAEDLSQDTFVRILSNEASHRELMNVRKPRSYLATIAGRLLIDFFRRQSLEKAYLEALALEPEGTEISTEARMAMLEVINELDAMLDGLGHKVKKAFLLSQLQGLQYAEIALILDVSVSSVKKYMAKATEHCLLFALQQGPLEDFHGHG